MNLRLNARMPRILIIDDQSSIVSLLTKFCKAEKYQVDSAMSGEVGLRMLRATLPDLVLVDLKLGDMTGLELMRTAKAEGCTSRFVFITGHGEVRTAVEAIKGGASDYLTKPLDMEELRRVIRETMEERAQGTTNRKLILVYPKQQPALAAV